jgi:hypothetical protein
MSWNRQVYEMSLLRQAPSTFLALGADPTSMREAGGSATAGACMDLALDVLSTASSEFGCCVDWR